jgi:hypothetical protein
MKTTFIVILSSFLLGCGDEHVNLVTHQVGVDLQSSFSNDQADVFLDGERILHGKFTTLDVLGVCPEGRKVTNLAEGFHVLKVVVNNRVVRETFTITGDQFIGIQFERTPGTITTLYSDHPFLYD